ncbi:MAG: agmatinase [Candidatus Altiarchaeota archaeon]
MVKSQLKFCGLERHFSDYSKARFAVLPVPYEKTTTYAKGTAKGPKAIMEASCKLELYDEELDSTPAESGIATLKPLVIRDKPEIMVRKVKDACLKILDDGKFPILLGGEHSISVGFLLALKERVPDVSVLQFDAHADLRESYRGSRYNHACVMARIRENVECVQVGIRSISDEESELVKKLRSDKTLFFAKDVLEGDCTKDIINRLSENVYITFDLDCMDPSIMPSTGTPEPGGLGWYDVLRILKAVTSAKNVVGFDVMELCPKPNSEASDFTAAKLAYKMLGYVNQRFFIDNV